MRAPDDSIDLAKVLSRHFDPTLATTRVLEVHKMLSPGNTIDKEERVKRGWDEAYDLRPWKEFPDTDNASVKTVVLQNLTGGWLGTSGGPTKESVDLGARLRDVVASSKVVR